MVHNITIEPQKNFCANIIIESVRVNQWVASKLPEKDFKRNQDTTQRNTAAFPIKYNWRGEPSGLTRCQLYDPYVSWLTPMSAVWAVWGDNLKWKPWS